VDKYSDVLSRADVWILAALTASDAAELRNFISWDMQYVGRPVCDGPANRGPDRQLPSSHVHTSQLLGFFQDEFGFTARETVAIIGAHTLGRAFPENSGYEGSGGWVGNQDRLDNGFYATLVSQGRINTVFSQEMQDNSGRVFPDQFLWRRIPSTRFMLNVDFALAVDLDGFLDPVSGEVSCRLSGNSNICPDSSTVDIVLEYANDNRAWVNDFHDALQKMTTHNCVEKDECFRLV